MEQIRVINKFHLDNGGLGVANSKKLLQSNMILNSLLFTCQLYRSQKMFHQILVMFEISNLATSVWVRGRGNVARG